jgi:hypothetical protein
MVREYRYGIDPDADPLRDRDDAVDPDGRNSERAT